MTKRLPRRPLTAKADKFARHYAVHRKPLEAYEQAGYSMFRSSKVEAAKILARPNVQVAIEIYRQKHVRKLDIRDESILKAFAAIGFSSIGDCIDETGKLKQWRDIHPYTQYAVNRVEFDGKGNIIKIWMEPKSPALTRLAEIKGLLERKQQAPVSVNVNLNWDQRGAQ